VGASETAEEFRQPLDVEAWERGCSRAEKKVVMGDGAEWIRNLAKPHFPAPFRSSIFITLAGTFEFGA